MATVNLDAPQNSRDNDRPSIIVRTKASTSSHQDEEEVATIVMAYRAPRVASHQSTLSSDRMLINSSRDLDASFEHSRSFSRSLTISSITSEGFKNMIASNRNSWTGSLGGSNVSAGLVDTDKEIETGTEEVKPLQNRDMNRQIENSTSENKKKLTEKVEERMQTSTRSPSRACARLSEIYTRSSPRNDTIRSIGSNNIMSMR